MTSSEAQVQEENHQGRESEVDTKNECDVVLRERVCSVIRELDIAIGRPPFPNPCTASSFNTACKVEKILRSLAECKRTHILRNECPEVMQTLPLLCAALPQGSITVNAPCIQLYEILLFSLCHVLSITNYQKDKIVNDALSILSLKSSSTLTRLLHAANALTPSLLEQILFPDKHCIKSVNRKNTNKNTNSSTKERSNAQAMLTKKEKSCNNKMKKPANHNNEKGSKLQQKNSKNSEVHVEQQPSEESINARQCDNKETIKPSLDVIHTLLDLPLSASCKAVLLRLFDSDESFTECVGNDGKLALHIMNKYGHQLINKLHPFTLLLCLNEALLPYLVSTFQSHAKLSDILHIAEWENKVEQWSFTLLDNLCCQLHDTNIKNSNARGLLFTSTFLLHVINNKESFNELSQTMSASDLANNAICKQETIEETKTKVKVTPEGKEQDIIIYLRMLLWETVNKSTMHIMKSATNTSRSDTVNKRCNTEQSTQMESQETNQTSLSTISAPSLTTETTQNYCLYSSVFDESTVECMTVLAHVAKHEIYCTMQYLVAQRSASQNDKRWTSLGKSADALYKNTLEPLCRVLAETCTKQPIKETNNPTNTNGDTTIAVHESQARNNQVQCKSTEQLLHLPLQCTQITTWLLTLCSNTEYKYTCIVHICKLLCERMKFNAKNDRTAKQRVLISAQEELPKCNRLLPNIFNIQQEQWCNKNMWNALIDSITIWGWQLEQTCILTQNTKRVNTKQIESYLELTKQFICEENVNDVLCAAVHDTGRVNWVSPFLFLLLLFTETTQTMHDKCTNWVHMLSSTFLSKVVLSLTKLNVQDDEYKESWRCSIAPLSPQEVIGVLFSYLTSDQLHYIAIEIIKRKLDTTLLHILEKISQEVQTNATSDHFGTETQENVLFWQEQQQQQALKKASTYSKEIHAEVIAEKCSLGYNILTSCLKEEIDLEQQRTKETRERWDAERAEQLLQHVYKATELQEDKELFDKLLQEKATVKQQEEMYIQTELSRRNAEKEEKRLAAQKESETRVREMMEQINRLQEEQKEEHKREERRRLELYQRKMLNNFNVVTFLEHLELSASRKWYIQQTIAHQCTEISPDELLEFIVTGNMKVPEDMCVDADNEGLVMSCNDDDNAVVVSDSISGSSSNKGNNDKKIVNSKNCNISKQGNEYVKERYSLTQMLKRNVSEDGKYDLWQVVMNDNLHEHDANDTQRQSQIATRWKDDNNNCCINDDVDIVNDNECTDANTMHHSFHYRVAFVLNLFSYEGGNEYGDLPQLLPSINVELANKVINQETLIKSGFKHLLEAFRSLERRELVSFDSNCTNVSLTRLGFRYHFPFHESDFALCTQLEARKWQIQSILRDKQQTESSQDIAACEVNSDDSNIQSNNAANNNADNIPEENIHINTQSNHAFLPEVIFDI